MSTLLLSYEISKIGIPYFLDFPMKISTPNLMKKMVTLNTSSNYPTPHCKEISIFVYPKKELRGLNPNFHI